MDRSKTTPPTQATPSSTGAATDADKGKQQMDQFLTSLNTWNNDDYCVMAYITRSLWSSLLVEIGSLNSEANMWAQLAERFIECAGAHRKGDASWQTHFNQLKDYWLELATMEPVTDAIYGIGRN